jgi:uncharacterized delta-60 repeat protein
MEKLILVACFLINIVVSAQPGSLDNTFGIGGKVVTDFGGSYDNARALAIQNDGKIVVVGYYGSPNNNDFALVRYNSDGRIDSTFGANGKVTTDFGKIYDLGMSVAIQSDDKIVVAGMRYNSSWDTTDFAVARYNNDGSLDSSFGNGGKVTTNFFGGSDDRGNSVVIQSDGKIVVAGSSIWGLALARYNNNGSLDNSFGVNGKVKTVIGSNGDYGYSVALQSDGKIVMGGISHFLSSTEWDISLIRYTTDGNLDSTFGSNGIVTADVGGSVDYAYSVIIQSDGKIVVAGSSYTCCPYASDFSLSRYNSSGVLDSTFDFDGKVITDFGNSWDMGYSAAIQPDGKIVVAGNSSENFALARYNSNGSLDPTFDYDGKVTTDFANLSDYGYSVVIQGNGKIVVAGSSNGDFALARYETGSSTVSIQENQEIRNIQIYPNPSQGIFTVDLKNKNGKATIRVYDLLGSCLLNKDCQNTESQEIDLSTRTKGFYFVEIVSDGERSVNKIVLQ